MAKNNSQFISFLKRTVDDDVMHTRKLIASCIFECSIGNGKSAEHEIDKAGNVNH